MRSPPSLKIRIDFDTDDRIGPGKIRLLEAINTCGSISAAARMLKMTYSGLELYVDEEGVVFQMPLTNKRYAEKIKALVKSNKQSSISIGITRSKERTEMVGKHQVVYIEQADLRECSLVAEGCCEQAFAYLIDVNDAPPLKDSVNSPSFKLESTAHNLNTQYRKRLREFAALTNRIGALQQIVDDDRAYMTAASRHSEFDTIDALQKAARLRLGLN